MWHKDDYQEHMLGYLGGVQAGIERLSPSTFQQYELNEFHSDLDNAFELLWWLIGSSDADWEDLRYTLEESCDTLLRAADHALGTPITKGFHFLPLEDEDEFVNIIV